MQRHGILAGLSSIAMLGGCLAPGDDAGATVEQASFGGSLGSVLGNQVASNNTSSLTNEHTPSCAPGGTAADVAYSWTAPSTGTYTFTTEGSEASFAPFNTVLEVRSFTTGASLGCNDDSNGGRQSTVSVGLTIGQAVRVVVDGNGSARGTFWLSISGPPGAPGRNYRCGYALAGFGCNGGRAGTVIQAADMTSAITSCHIAQPANLPDFCNVIDQAGTAATDASQCTAAGGAWRKASSCCNFVGSVTCPS